MKWSNNTIWYFSQVVIELCQGRSLKNDNLNSFVSLVSHIIKREVEALAFLELLIVGKHCFLLLKKLKQIMKFIANGVGITKLTNSFISYTKPASFFYR